jgi:predicted Rossmann fold flavoprotein
MNQSEVFDFIVIGGGAAGMMAAGQAASFGAKTLLLEKMDQAGRKILISGKFRCNLTNTAPIPEFLDHFGKSGKFLRQAFHRFFSPELIHFFNVLGVKTLEERGGRVFPVSNRAQDVVQALITWLETNSVTIQPYSPVLRLNMEDHQVCGVLTPQAVYQAEKVLVATGGASYPGTGSTGDGYTLAESAGHTVIPILPALVPLVTAGSTAQRLQGLSLRNVEVSTWIQGKKKKQAFGEMVFTHFGISGPIILTLSKGIVAALQAGQHCQISIDLKPALDEPKLDLRLLRDLNNQGKKYIRTLLKGLLPLKLIPVCLDHTEIPAEKNCNQVTAEDRNRLLTWLKDFRLDVIDHRGFRHAIITAGGVDTREINPRTMESLLVKGLYFAGEVIDVDADTGGYNLQAAFSTGWLAGRSAAASGDEND